MFTGGDDVGSAGAHAATPHAQGDHDPYLGLIDQNPDAICVHQDGRLVFCNATAVRWLGAGAADELVGHAVSDVLHPRSTPLVIAQLAALHRPGDTTSETPATAVRVDGTEFDVAVVSVLTSWNGGVAHQLIMRDHADHRSARVALGHQAALVAHAGDAVIAVAASGIVTSWNAAAERIYRRPAQRALALPVGEAVGAPVDLTAIADAGGIVHSTHHAMDGTARAIRVSATAFEHGHVLVCSDETVVRRAASNLRKVVNTLQEGVAVVDRNGWVLTINPAARRILGLRSARSGSDPGVRLGDLRLVDTDGVPLVDDERPVAVAFATGRPTVGRVIGVDRPDGTRVWLSASCHVLQGEDPEHSPVLVSFSDISVQRAAAEQLAHQAAHDELTGLPNRAHLLKTVDRLRRERRVPSAVLFIDLDDLKTVNDSLGHDGGDVVIQTTAHRLRRSVRSHDIVGRFAGDEFVALLTGNLENGALGRFVDHLHRVLAEPIDVPGGKLRLGASIGVIRTRHDDPRDAATLLRAADAAMYAAKAKGRRASRFLPHA